MPCDSAKRPDKKRKHQDEQDYHNDHFNPILHEESSAARAGGNRQAITCFSPCVRSATTLFGHKVRVTSNTEVLARIREQRRKLADIGPTAERAPGDFELVALPYGDASALRDLLIAHKARTVIEIGLAYGSSALAIAEALASQGIEGARHVIIDAFQEQFNNAGWNAIVAAGQAEVSSLISQRSQLALPHLIHERFTADAAFVDGSHIFHNVFVDLFFLRELLSPGGLIILDDCHYRSVAAAVRYFELNTGWQPVEMSATRLRAYQLPEPRVEPSFEDFRAFV